MKSPDTKRRPSGGSTVIDPIAEWVHGLNLSDVPALARDEAYRCLIDGIGVALAGSRNQTVINLAEPSEALYGRGDCTALTVPGSRLSAPAAALINGTAGHVLDFDDTSYTGIFHATAVCWPAALAAAETRQASGHRFLEAFIAGVETCYALADFLGHSIYFDGWWTTSLLGQVGAAASVAKIYDLDASQTAAAIGLAMATSAGSRAVLGSPAKPLGVGIAARQGYEAAILAQAGHHAGADVAGADHGWVSRLKPDVVLHQRLDKLGSQYGLLNPGILFKQYPLCSAALAAGQAAANLAENHDLKDGDIARVECIVTPLVATSLKFPQPRSSEQAQFSLPFAVACAILYGTVEPAHLDLAHLENCRLRDLMDKVEMRISETLDGALPDPGDGPEGAVVTIRTESSEQHTHARPVAYGMPTNRMSTAVLAEKFSLCCRERLTSKDTATLIDRLFTLEKMDNMAGLFDGVDLSG